MNSLSRVIPLILLLLTAAPTYGAYVKVITASPTAAFEVQYPLNHPTQTLRVGTSYPYAGASGELYFIRYTFEDGRSHLVRVPKASKGEPLIELQGSKIKVLRSFKFTFTKGSILFDPRNDYTVLEKSDEQLVLEFNETAGRITVPADKFKCKTSLQEQRGTIDQQLSEAKGQLISNPARCAQDIVYISGSRHR
jgi:hypothetical protein